jgi:hypothetical protein
MSLATIRVLSEACKNEFTSTVLEVVELDLLLDALDNDPENADDELIVAVQFCLQALLNDLSGLDVKKRTVNVDRLQRNESIIDRVMRKMFERSARHSTSALGRDALLELCAKNVDVQMLNWGEKALNDNCLVNILEIAGELGALASESSMRLTNATKTHVAFVLERVYGCLFHDKLRDQFRSIVTEFVRSLVLSADVNSQLRAVSTVTTLLAGPLDVGNHCLAQDGMIELMMSLARSGQSHQQMVALEAIIAASTKKDKCASIIKNGAEILKDLYDCGDDAVKVRALVGLCKLGSFGGVDASVRPFTSDQSQQLFDACRTFIVSSNAVKNGAGNDRTGRDDVKRWAIEGLAFLTLDANIKQIVCDDIELIECLMRLAKGGQASVAYGVITTLCNLTNSYDKQEVLPEMLELAKFAKQHVPIDHEKDAKEFVDRRCELLVGAHVTTALVELAKTESETSRESIARIFNAITEQTTLRGQIVQQGGARALIPLASDGNTIKGKQHAAQAIARIAISINPEMAFPGQRLPEIVRPLVSLLDFDCSALQNFEALMALTNLAQVSPTIQGLILKMNGFSKIDHYMYEEHEHLKRAAVQCIANLILNPAVVAMFEGDNDRIKYLVALCEDEDLDTAKAAAGALAMVTCASELCCQKVLTSKVWTEILIMLCSSKDAELQHRGLYLLRNLMQAGKALAEQICATDLLEVLMALVRPEVDDIPLPLKQLAQESLDKAIEYKLIKTTSR